MTHIAAPLSFPATRPRRLRQNESIRKMTQEFSITANDLVMPYFIVEGEKISQKIPSMPQINRLSIDFLLQELAELTPLGLRAIALFPVTPPAHKDKNGSYALDPNNLICRAIKAVKQEFPHLLIIADVALDPYTSHGHDGVIDENGNMLNDETVDILIKQSLNQAQAGADIIAPSDMCDGRIGKIRDALEAANYPHTMIMAYSVKYASGFYGPFRDAVSSSGALKGDKKTYQMDFHNRQEALNEAMLDISEGADIIIIKPAMLYADIIRDIATKVTVPICAYQVSGEYAMIDFAARQNFAPRRNLITESLVALKRAGSQMIISYFTKELLNENYLK